MLRSNHYDVAFEHYLRLRRVPYVAVDETRRTLLADASLKSMDFIVYSPAGPNLLIDVKGRRRVRGRKWENWASVEDIEALLKWQEVFGSDFRSLLVFAYDSTETGCPQPGCSTIEFQSRTYQFFGVWVNEYQNVMKLRSPSWQTVWLRREDYQKSRFPLDQVFTDTSLA